jgi:predicted adenylyl cyclase CyaB
VNKKRLSYLYQEVEISVDEVEELGDFVELEMKGTFTSKDEAVETLYLLAETLGLSRETEDKKGYPYLLLEQKELL